MMRLFSWVWWTQQAASVPAIAGVIAASLAIGISPEIPLESEHATRILIQIVSKVAKIGVIVTVLTSSSIDDTSEAWSLVFGSLITAREGIFLNLQAFTFPFDLFFDL
jgi:hypothetical protein